MHGHCPSRTGHCRLANAHRLSRGSSEPALTFSCRSKGPGLQTAGADDSAAEGRDRACSASQRHLGKLYLSNRIDRVRSNFTLHILDRSKHGSAVHELSPSRCPLLFIAWIRPGFACRRRHSGAGWNTKGLILTMEKNSALFQR
jgi:hypothetical protein